MRLFVNAWPKHRAEFIKRRSIIATKRPQWKSVKSLTKSRLAASAQKNRRLTSYLSFPLMKNFVRVQLALVGR